MHKLYSTYLICGRVHFPVGYQGSNVTSVMIKDPKNKFGEPQYPPYPFTSGSFTLPSSGICQITWRSSSYPLELAWLLQSSNRTEMNEVATSSTWLREAVSTMVMSRPSIWWVNFFFETWVPWALGLDVLYWYMHIYVNMQLELELKGVSVPPTSKHWKLQVFRSQGGHGPYFQASTKIEKILWLPDCRSTPPTAMRRSAFKIPKAQQACCCSNSGQVPLTNGDVLNAFPLSKQIRM